MPVTTADSSRWRRLPWRAGLATALLLTCGGCQPTDQPPAAYTADDDRGPWGLVTLQVADAKQFTQVIESHRGQVILVDFWATYCAPCQRQFPHTVQLQREYRDEGLIVVTVSLDDPDDQEAVLEFLRASNADFQNLISANGAGAESFREFNIPGGALPYYQLYDQQGELRFEFSFDHRGIQSRIEQLLAESVQR